MGAQAAAAAREVAGGIPLVGWEAGASVDAAVAAGCERHRPAQRLAEVRRQPPLTDSSASAMVRRCSSDSSRDSSQRSGSATVRDEPARPRWPSAASPGHGASRVERGEQRVERRHRVDERERVADRRPGGESLEVPGDVLADVAAGALLLAVEVARGMPCASGACRRPPRASGVTRAGVPAKAAARSVKSHGRPRQPRPTTTPSQPVSRTMRRASSADQMSPLPRTGMRRHGLLEQPDGAPVGGAGVGLRRGAAVQRDRGDALLPRRSARRRGR